MATTILPTVAPATNRKFWQEFKELPIPLSEKKTATLIYPLNITEKDIQILRKQIELLELTL